MLIDPKAKLAEVLGHAQKYLDLAVEAKDRAEREACERIAGLYLKIAEELEALMDR
jgi:hypothetical protein